MRRVRPLTTLLRIFTTGALAALPLAATVLLFAWTAGVLVRWLGPESAVGRLLISIGLSVGGSEVVGYALGIGIVAASLFVLGLLVEAGLQRGASAAFSALITRIPIVGTVYDLFQKMFGLFAPKDVNAEGLKSMAPVWCHFGGPSESGSSAALALLGSDEVVLVKGQRCLAILIPTAPVPVGGGLLYVPEHWVTPAEIGIEAVTSIYVSMGLTSAQHLPRG